VVVDALVPDKDMDDGGDGGGGGGGEREGREDDDEDGGNGGPGGRGGRPHPSENKFLRTLVVWMHRSRTKTGTMAAMAGAAMFAAATAATGTGPKKTCQARMTCCSLRGRPRLLSRKMRNTGSYRGGGPCVLGYKFVRDVERINEWEVKTDYAVMKYGRKVDCLRSPDKVGEEAGTKQCGGGGGGGMNPCCILTGLRSQRGEVVRWMV
jgi:hypothetical protein